MAITDVYGDDIDGPHLVDLIAQRPPPGQSLPAVSQQDLAAMSSFNFAPITARRCEIERDQAVVLRRIREAAALAGSDYFYSFPVKKRGGGTDYIEGITIDGAMAVLLAYGNSEVDCRYFELPNAWIFLARFVDHERGISLVRPFMQRKEGSKLGGTDDGRRQEIAFSIGASKATRNVIANALRPLTNFCFEEAKNDLVKRVGARLPEHKKRAVERLAELGVDLKRVEALTGRTVDEWNARDVAGVLTQVATVRKGLAMPNDIWPPAVAEPRRSDTAAPEPSTPKPQTPDGEARGTDDDSVSSSASSSSPTE